MADVAGFSRLMGRDEEGTTREIQAFHARVRDRVTEHEGRIVDTAGDSVFGEFDSVVNATRCAQAVQADQAQRNATTPPHRRIETRIGVHVGDVIVEEYKIYGDGVNIAARLESLAEPGQILVSEAVYQQVRNKVDAEFADEGVRSLKNIDHPVRVYRLVPSALEVVAPAFDASFAEPEPLPVRSADRPERFERFERPELGLAEALLRPDVAVPLTVGLALLVSPIVLFPTGGVFPVGGSVLTGLTLGRVVERRYRRRGGLLIGLGLGLAAGALFTRWGAVLSFLFVLAGAIVGVQGLAQWARGPRRAARLR
jgi:class 3 adenylate cyclase